jgi:hypothetical protein
MIVKRDRRRKLDQLDNLFLFATSSLGYVFIIIQFIFGKIAIPLLFLPLLVFGVATPVRKGYIHGALRNSLPDRIRGWIYFSFGLVIYIWFTVSFGIINFCKNTKFLFLALFSGIILLSLLYTGYRFVTFIASKYGYQITKKDWEILFPFITFGLCYWAFSLLAYFGYLIFELYQIDPLKFSFLFPYAAFLFLLGIVGCLAIFYFLQKK